MGAGRRHETLGSKKKDISDSTARSMMIGMFMLIHVRTTRRAQMDGCTQRRLHTGGEGNTGYGETSVLQQAVSKPVLSSEADVTSSVTTAYCEKSNFQFQV